MAIVALPGVIPFDLAVPCEVFSRVRLADGSAPYEVRVCGPAKTIDSASFQLRVPHGLAALETADTIFLPGLADFDAPIPKGVVQALRDAHARGARLASICTGAFVLAATGLLAGRRATTHWLAAAELERRHPAIEVDPSVLFVDGGTTLTSAGAAAGIDLCLHIVRRDHGAAVAAEQARLAVVPLQRDGGQAQFIAHPLPSDDGESLAPVLQWIEDNLDQSLSLDAIARRAALSKRSLSRRFRAQTGTTPAQWVTQARIRRAQQLLETTEHSVERVATLVGFACVTTFRTQFQRIVGNGPRAYRRTFRPRTVA